MGSTTLELPVSLDSLAEFLGNVFGLGINTMVSVLEVIWPYLIVVAVLYIFWRVGRSFFRGR